MGNHPGCYGANQGSLMEEVLGEILGTYGGNLSCDTGHMTCLNKSLDEV